MIALFATLTLTLSTAFAGLPPGDRCQEERRSALEVATKQMGTNSIQVAATLIELNCSLSGPKQKIDLSFQLAKGSEISEAVRVTVAYVNRLGEISLNGAEQVQAPNGTFTIEGAAMDALRQGRPLTVQSRGRGGFSLAETTIRL